MSTEKTQPTASSSSAEFHPPTEFKEDEKSHTVVLHLPGFKKEQLRVQVDNSGRVKISGEQWSEGHKSTRFQENFQIPQNTNFREIKARFENQALYVIMPKSTTTSPSQKAPSESRPKTKKEEGPNKKTDSSAKQHAEEMPKKDTTQGNGLVGDKKIDAERSWRRDGTILGEKTPKNIVMQFVLAVAVALAVAVYVAYRFKYQELKGEQNDLLYFLADNSK